MIIKLSQYPCQEFVIKSESELSCPDPLNPTANLERLGKIEKPEANITIIGYASVFNVLDQHNDIMVKGAFKNSEAKKTKLLWQHDTGKPIGIIKHFIEDDYGLKIEAEINASTVNGKEATALLKQKAIEGLSIGFSINSFEYNEKGQRLIADVNLMEISVVTFPANEQASVTFIKHLTSLPTNTPSFLTNYSKPKEKPMQDNHDVVIDESKELANLKKSYSKITELESKVNNIQNYLGDPEISTVQDAHQKKAFGDYLRKGSISELLTKSLSSNEDSGGEVTITPTLQAQIINAVNERSVMRSLASAETISSNALDLIKETGKFVAGWVGEMEERADTDNAKLVRQRINVHELYAQPKATQRLLDDSAINLEQWLTERLVDRFVAAEDEAFFTGDGDKKPTGLLNNALEDESMIKILAESGVSTELLLTMVNSLPEEYLRNATFVMNRTTLSLIQNLQDESGRFIWQPSLSDALKQTIFGIPVVCSSYMPNIDKDALAIALGDFKSAYKIVDRQGVNLMRDPYTDKPFVKFYAVKRVGGAIVNPKSVIFAKFAERAEREITPELVLEVEAKDEE